MPAPARLADTTNHGRDIIGSSERTLLVRSTSASVLGDTHVYAIPYPVHIMISAFPMGSTRVLSGSKPAIRNTDSAVCGAMAVVDEPTVEIG